jgi:hypothetical protein
VERVEDEQIGALAWLERTEVAAAERGCPT